MVYNARLYNYADGLQLRVYNRPIICNQKANKPKDNTQDLKIKSSDVRTFEQEKHSSTSSLNRTIQDIYEISRSNTWHWFLTFTLNPKVIDRTNYDLIVEKVSKWFNNTRSRYAPNLKYLLVPELHSDGESFHFHAIISNIGSLEMKFSGKVSFNKKIYPYTRKPYGTKIYNMPRWYFGWTTATKVVNNARVASYITKYITKDLCAVAKNKKRYWHSRNCERPQVEYLNLDYDKLDEIVANNLTSVGHISTSQVPDAGLEIMYIEFNESEGILNDCRTVSKQIQMSSIGDKEQSTIKKDL